MADRYKIAFRTLRDAALEPKEGNELRLKLPDGNIVPAKITEIQKDSAIVTLVE
jgi:hypothetical protein